jgi:hypothetical protein
MTTTTTKPAPIKLWRVVWAEALRRSSARDR